jgi:peptide subunit release factor RF-3
VHLFERTAQGAYRAPVHVADLSDPEVKDKLDTDDYDRAVEELEMLDIAGVEYDSEKVHHGDQTPVFFGSAANNFGVPTPARRLPRALPPPAAAPERGRWHHSRRCALLLRLRLQNPGQHGSPAPGSHRVPAHLLRQVFPRTCR